VPEQAENQNEQQPYSPVAFFFPQRRNHGSALSPVGVAGFSEDLFLLIYI
jgi:hypothetical protein